MLTKEKGAICEIAPENIIQSHCITYQEIYKMVGEITKLGAIITDTTKTDLFVNYSGHIKSLEVLFYNDGWVKDNFYDKRINVSLNPHSCLYNFKAIEELKETLYNMIDPKNHYLLGGM